MPWASRRVGFAGCSVAPCNWSHGGTRDEGLVVSGGELVLNVNTGAGGMIRVEVLNATTNEPLPLFSNPRTDFSQSHGRSRDDSGSVKQSPHVVPLVANSISASVQWRALTKVDGGATVWQKYGLESLRGQQVKLRFRMVGTKLYSYSLV